MSDDREVLAPAELGRLMSLILDAADPRKTPAERDAAAAEAEEISAPVAYVVAVGYLRTVLDGVQHQPKLGTATTESILNRLASVSVGMIGHLKGEGE